MRLRLPDPDATDALGAALAASRPIRAVLYLHGDLGAGKSTLARAMLRALGVRGAIRSPTYTLIERYTLLSEQGETADEAVHIDLYRIAAADELEFLGFDDLVGHVALWLIEWPERGGQTLPQADLHVHLALEGEGREAVLESASPAGLIWLDRLGAGTRATGRSDTFSQIPGAPF